MSKLYLGSSLIGTAAMGSAFQGKLQMWDNPYTWDKIIAACADGTYKTKYKIGDTVPLDLGTEGIVNMEIVAMDTDELADGSG